MHERMYDATKRHPVIAGKNLTADLLCLQRPFRKSEALGMWQRNRWAWMEIQTNRELARAKSLRRQVVIGVGVALALAAPVYSFTVIERADSRISHAYMQMETDLNSNPQYQILIRDMRDNRAVMEANDMAMQAEMHKLEETDAQYKALAADREENRVLMGENYSAMQGEMARLRDAIVKKYRISDITDRQRRQAQKKALGIGLPLVLGGIGLALFGLSRKEEY